MFPAANLLGTDRFLELAAIIYWDKVEPEREQALARKAAELRASGLNVSQIAAQFGVTKERANRLIAISDAGA